MNKNIAWVVFPIIFIIICAISILVYKTSPTAETPTLLKPIQCNFCILLDLSDRIDINKSPNQAKRDQVIIGSIFEIFADRVKKKLYVNSKDVLQVAIAPQPTNYDTILYKISGNLKIDMSKLKITEKRNSLPVLEKSFHNCINLLYDRAIKNSEFLGSDIWSFFRDDIDNYIISSKEDSIRNFLIILTDGYLEFEKSVLSRRPMKGKRTTYMDMSKFRNHPNWEIEFDSEDHGLIPINRDFSNLRVLVLEVTPKIALDPTELEIIKKYWLKWFQEMHIPTTDGTINKSEYPTEKVKEIIEKFISQE